MRCNKGRDANAMPLFCFTNSLVACAWLLHKQSKYPVQSNQWNPLQWHSQRTHQTNYLWPWEIYLLCIFSSPYCCLLYNFNNYAFSIFLFWRQRQLTLHHQKFTLPHVCRYNAVYILVLTWRAPACLLLVCVNFFFGMSKLNWSELLCFHFFACTSPLKKVFEQIK